jgi:hypothetical protein
MPIHTRRRVLRTDRTACSPRWCRTTAVILGETVERVHWNLRHGPNPARTSRPPRSRMVRCRSSCPFEGGRARDDSIETSHLLVIKVMLDLRPRRHRVPMVYTGAHVVGGAFQPAFWSASQDAFPGGAQTRQAKRHPGRHARRQSKSRKCRRCGPDQALLPGDCTPAGGGWLRPDPTPPTTWVVGSGLNQKIRQKKGGRRGGRGRVLKMKIWSGSQ